MKDLRERIGQLLFVGVSSTSLTEGEKKFLKGSNIGGVILFKRNYESLSQLVELTAEIRSLTKKPFIGVDQEGGKVIRFGSPFSQFPGNDYLGRYYEKTGRLDLAKEYAIVTARELKSAGLNLCFAPVLDVLTNPQNEVIGARAFSSKPDTVSKLGSAVIEAFKSEGMLSCAKHFPGHGDTLLDSHVTLPRSSADTGVLMKRELLPFKDVLHDVPFMMTAHVLYEPIDDKYPATLSTIIIKGILREQLRYENVVISDDFEMKGLADSFGMAEAAVMAIKAGVDIILVCHSMEKMVQVYEALAKETEKEDFRNKLSVSLKRVERIKREYDIGGMKPDIKVARRTFNEKKSKVLIEKIKAFA